MATTVTNDADLRNRMRGEPGVTPEDTRSELLEDLQSQALRNRMRGEPGMSPEDTRSELFEDLQSQALRNRMPSEPGMSPEDIADARASDAKIERKEAEAIAMKKDREETARSWTPVQAQARAARDAADHADIVDLGPRGKSDAYYLRKDMAEQASVNAAYDAALKTGYPDLYKAVQENSKNDVSINLAAFHAATAEAQKNPKNTEQGAAVDKGLLDQLEDDLRRRKAREQEQAGQGLNSVDVTRSGKELERGEFIVPRKIAQTYTEVDGKFYAKDSNRVMFEDKGEKLATSTTDAKAIADMVAYAKAKQWESFKLAGSQEFRREAWLQAESQGIKTQGYTPKQADLAALETLRQQRATNAITPMAERKPIQQEAAPVAPRHDLNKNQAAMHAEASKSVTTNMEALQKLPGMANRSVEDLTKLAYWRGIVAEENKLQPGHVKDEAVARFDKQATDPQFLNRINQETEGNVKDRTTDRVQQRETPEISR